MVSAWLASYCTDETGVGRVLVGLFLQKEDAITATALIAKGYPNEPEEIQYYGSLESFKLRNGFSELEAVLKKLTPADVAILKKHKRW